MNLKHLTDTTLLKDTKALVQKERELTAQILHHLKEIEVRKLYSDLKYASLFEFCIKELGYSEACAHRRIAASRLLNEIPSLERKIENGDLSLSNIAKASQFFKENEINDLKEKKSILLSLENMSVRECDKKLETMKHGDLLERTVRISLKENTVIALDQLRALKGVYHSYDELLIEMIKDSKMKTEKQKFKQHSRVTSLPAQEAGRVISAYVKRHVYLRDKRCTQCGTNHNLQFDQRVPFALGGKSSRENVRLLCFNCNQRARIKARL